MATNDGNEDAAGASEGNVAGNASASDGAVGTSMGIGHDMGELSDDDNDPQDSVSFADAPTGQEDEEGTDQDLSMTDEVDYTAYDDSDLKDMQKDFTARQNALPVTQRHNAHAIRSELRALTENVRSKDPATIFGINYSKDRHTQQEKQAMVQSFMDKHGKAIDDMAKDHNAEMNAKGKKGGVIGGAMSAMQSPAGMLLGATGGLLGTLGMALSGALSAAGLQHHSTDIETDLDSLMQEVGMKEKDAQADVSDPSLEELKVLCEGREGYRWDDATQSCVVDTTKDVDPIDVVNPA